MKKKQIGLFILIGLLIFALGGLAWFGIEKAKISNQQKKLKEEIAKKAKEPLFFKYSQAWNEKKSVNYYDFGPSTNEIGKLYVLIKGFDSKNKPIRIPDQLDIYDSLRGEKGYSDFREIVYVQVKSDYKANSIKTADEAKKLALTTHNEIINQPQIRAIDKIEPDKIKQEGWYKGTKIYAWRFEENLPRDPLDSKKVGVNNVYIPVKISKDKKVKAIYGQKKIIELMPGQTNYSPLWRVVIVQVPDDYKANSITSIDEIVKGKYKSLGTKILVNSPVTK
jgi:hypothetical protein